MNTSTFILLSLSLIFVQVLLFCGLLVACLCSYMTLIGAGVSDDPFREAAVKLVGLRKRLRLAARNAHSLVAAYNAAPVVTVDWQQSSPDDDDD